VPDGAPVPDPRTAPIPYLPLEQHGVIGNGRTAALVAADGTVDWLCAPDFDGTVLFGALLDVQRGGFWRVGPAVRRVGVQHYDTDNRLSTRWTNNEYELVVTDALGPGPAVVRRVECLRGSVRCGSRIQLAVNFSPVDWRQCSPPLHAWSSCGAFGIEGGTMQLLAGDSVWLTLSSEGAPISDDEACARLFSIPHDRPGARASGHPLTRSEMVLRTLQYAPTGAMVAAPTTSIPERIGGGWNVDYRLCWVRDSSLAMTALIRLGDRGPAERYLKWLTTLGSQHTAPLQTLYDIRGGERPTRRERRDLEGYRGSKPVRFGNHAFRQLQLDIFGYLADCALTLIEAGGICPPEVWQLLETCARFVADHWREPDHSLWELPAMRHYTSSRVMCWVTLDRVTRIGAHLSQPVDKGWADTASAIRDEVLAAGWNAAMGAFTQTLGGRTLDASALLIPIYGLLPAGDPRVLATIDRIADRLTIDGFVYRFDPTTMPELDQIPLGESEGAFVPCTLWLATVYRLLGRTRVADAIVGAIDQVAGSTGLLGEAVDPRTKTFAGNFPLGFSHAEYIRTAFTS